MSEQTKRKIVEALSAVAQRSLSDVNENLRPIEDMGFDSMDGISIACELSAQLEIAIPDDINPLVNDKEKRGSTIAEIVELVETLMETKD